MRVVLPFTLVASLCLGLHGGAFAQEAADHGAPKAGPEKPAADLSVGVGVICDTAEQMKLYFAHYRGDTSAEAAADMVNTETKSPGGCGMASVAFLPGDFVENVAVTGGVMRMLKIVVFAMKTEKGWEMIAPTQQYTALFVKLDEA